MAGRPSTYSDAVAADICGRLADGQSLRSIAQQEGMPSMSTVMSWLAKNGEFRNRYAFARELQAEAIVDEILEIADDSTNDRMKRNAHDGNGSAGWKVNAENVQRARLRIDARKWLLAKLAPKKYGDKVEVRGRPGSAIDADFERVFRQAERDGS